MVKKIVYLVVLIVLTGCLNYEAYESYSDHGLKEVRVKVSDENYNNIYKTSFVNEWITATLSEEDKSDVIKLRRQGKSSRKYPKPNFKSMGSHETAVYSGQYYDKSIARYYLATYFFKKAGFHMPEVEPVVVHLNDKPLGLYLKREFIDDDYFRRRGISVTSLYRVNHGVSFTFKTGMAVHAAFEKKIPHKDLTYTDLELLIRNLDNWENEAAKAKALSMLDIKNILDYYAVSVLLSNYDCITYNYYFMFNKSTKKFEFVPWDLDRTFAELEDSLPVYHNGLFEKLLSIEENAQYVAQRQRELFDPVELKTVLGAYMDRIRIAYESDPYLAIRPIESHEAEIGAFIDSVQTYLYR